MPANKRHEGGK
jgi:ribosomal protein S21